MRRNMDLARRVLFEIEASTDEEIELDLEGHSPQEISYHVVLLKDAGLILARDLSGYGGDDWQPERLTWEGHEFLDAARDTGRWDKAKELVKEKAGSLTFDALKAVLIKLATDAAFG